MPSARLILLLLLVLCFALAARLEPWHAQLAGERRQADDLLTALMGDSRRLFASHFFLKADAYYHLGYYPSIFERAEAKGGPAIAADAGLQPGDPEHHKHEGEHEDHEKHGGHTCDYLGKPLDWLDRFSRHFYPSTHLHADESQAGRPNEMLPWLRLAAELDPQRAETYTVTAFWLRNMGRVREAEQFLREGMRANPGNPEILFELGRVYFESHRDPTRARNVWEAALRRWDEVERAKPEPNIFLRQQIVGHLAMLEEKEGHWSNAIGWLMELKKNSPNADFIEKEIERLKANINRETPK